MLLTNKETLLFKFTLFTYYPTLLIKMIFFKASSCRLISNDLPRGNTLFPSPCVNFATACIQETTIKLIDDFSRVN